MGKLLIEYGVPAIFMLCLFMLVVKIWYLVYFPQTIKESRKINKASQRYDKELN